MPDITKLNELLEGLDLPALVEDTPSAADVVQDWADRAIGAVERWQMLNGSGSDSGHEDPELAELAYDLLAAWSGLARLDTDLVEGMDVVVTRIEKTVRENPHLLVALASVVPEPSGWMEEAADWVESCVDPALDPMEAAHTARCLLTDLDDAQLVAHALGRLSGESAEKLEEELTTCVAFAIRNADMFTPADVFVRRTAEAMDPDLEHADPELAQTQATFAHALIAIGELSGEPETVPVSDAEAAAWHVVAEHVAAEGILGIIKRLAAAVQQQGDRLGKAITAPLIVPQFQLIDGTGSGTTPPPDDVKRWRGVEGDWSATINLLVPGQEQDDREVVLRVFGAGWGDRVVLQGLERHLDCSVEGSGTAKFKLGELRAAQQEGIPASLALIRAEDDTIDLGEMIVYEED